MKDVLIIRERLEKINPRPQYFWFAANRATGRIDKAVILRYQQRQAIHISSIDALVETRNQPAPFVIDDPHKQVVSQIEGRTAD